MLREDGTRFGRGNTICPDTSMRSQSIAVLSRHQAVHRIEISRQDIKPSSRRWHILPILETRARHHIGLAQRNRDRPAVGLADETTRLNMLAGRFPDACFWCADRMTMRASERASEPCPPLAKGGKERTQIGMNSELVQNRRFITPGRAALPRPPGISPAGWWLLFLSVLAIISLHV